MNPWDTLMLAAIASGIAASYVTRRSNAAALLSVALPFTPLALMAITATPQAVVASTGISIGYCAVSLWLRTRPLSAHQE